jgi:predicted NUDIX family NTP pyrophosphohydrolase
VDCGRGPACLLVPQHCTGHLRDAKGENAGMPPQSAGILLYRLRSGAPDVLLVHPGGPFWARKDLGAWSIPKGELFPGEEPLEAARREWLEEIGSPLDGPFTPMRPVRQPGGKVVLAWAVCGDLDPSTVRSNTFSLEWPRGSGRFAEFPEVDRAEWFSLSAARGKILKGQLPLLDELKRILASAGP